MKLNHFPVLFYFDDATKLHQYAAFTIEKAFPVRPDCKPSTTTMFNVVGLVRAANRREVIAEFPQELYARIFRDMCEGLVRRESLLTGIHSALDAQEWSPDTLDAVATLMRASGFHITDTH
ncbi:TPA: hypothetical protein ACPWNY_005951 [Pseudomonas aeruginosa]